MRLETGRRHTPTINVSALVDVIFTLLIFLLLAATFTRVGRIDVSLPEAESTSHPDRSSVTVTVPAEGPLLVDDEEVAEDFLTEKLAAQRRGRDALLIVADGSVALQRAVSVLEAAGRAGFVAVSIATRQPRSEAGGDEEP